MLTCVIVRRWLLGSWFVVALALFAFVVTRQPLGEIVDACGAMGLAVALAPVIACGLLATRAALLGQVLGGRVPWRVRPVRDHLIANGPCRPRVEDEARRPPQDPGLECALNIAPVPAFDVRAAAAAR